MAKAVRSIHVGLPEGHGEVYRARDPKLNRDVAIKILPEALPAQGLVQAGVMAVSGGGPWAAHFALDRYNGDRRGLA